MKFEEVINQYIGNRDSVNGAVELLAAFKRWKGEKSNVELYQELGINLATPEFAAMSAIHAVAASGVNGNPTEAEAMKVMAGLSDCSLFGLWLGNRLEKLGRSL